MSGRTPVPVEEVIRANCVVGTSHALQRNRLYTTGLGRHGTQELTCTTDRRLVVLGHEPIAGFARDHGEVADQAAMLALHTLDSATLQVDPRFVAPGDSCTRMDDSGWRWFCLRGHGTQLSDWERRPLAAAIDGIVDSVAALESAVETGLAGAQPLDSDLTAIAAQGLSAWGLARIADSGATAAKNALGIQRSDITDATVAGRALLSAATPAEPSVPVISAAGAVTTTPLSSLGGAGGSGDLVTDDWLRRVAVAGGTIGPSSQARAQSLITSLRSAGMLRRLVRLDAWLGSDAYTACAIPLIDRFGRYSRVAGVSDAQVSETAGVTFAGSGYIDTLVRPSELGAGGRGGMGWWEAVATASGSELPMGCYSSDDTNRYVLDLRSTLRSFRWGVPGNGAGDSTGRAAGHYYGQRSSATSRGLYLNGSLLGTNTTSDTATGVGDRTIYLGGSNNTAGARWTGRCLAAYLTDGILSSGEITALHTVLSDWLTAIGRA